MLGAAAAGMHVAGRHAASHVLRPAELPRQELRWQLLLLLAQDDVRAPVHFPAAVVRCTAGALCVRACRVVLLLLLHLPLQLLAAQAAVTAAGKQATPAMPGAAAHAAACEMMRSFQSI
jgi:hypothetical protein